MIPRPRLFLPLLLSFLTLSASAEADERITAAPISAGVEGSAGVHVGGESFVPAGPLGVFRYTLTESLSFSTRAGVMTDGDIYWIPVWVGASYVLRPGTVQPVVSADLGLNILRVSESEDETDVGGALSVGAEWNPRLGAGLGPITGRVGFAVIDIGRMFDTAMLTASVGVYLFAL
jgi:hypothetical protein